MANLVCELKDIEKKYGPETVLGPLSVRFERGSVTGLHGPNGAGKSTLLAILAGAVSPSSGSRETAGGRIIYVPQDISLYPSLSGRDNLSFWAGVYGLKGRESAARIDRVLEEAELSDKASKRVETYSGGMKRRLNIAAAMLVPAELLLLDEPTAGCDSHSVDIILDTIRRAADRHSSVVIADHSPEELERVCSRILHIRNGSLVSEQVL